MKQSEYYDACTEFDPFFKNARKSSAEMGFVFLPMPDTDHDGAYFSPGSAVGAVAKFPQLHLK